MAKLLNEAAQKTNEPSQKVTWFYDVPPRGCERLVTSLKYKPVGGN